MASALPIWVQYMQALGVPVFGGIIAAIGAYIARQQMRIARAKLMHDLYERRFKLFDATRSLLEEVAVLGDASDKSIQRYSIAIADAPFLFNASVVAYLKWLGDEASRIHVLRSSLSYINDPYQKADAERKSTELVEQLRGQLPTLAAKFQPFLKLPDF